MRVHLKTEGGVAYFPGLSTPIQIDSNDVSDQEVSALHKLIVAADFFNLPSIISQPKTGATDMFRYTIAVQDGKKEHSVYVTEPIENPDLLALIRYIKRAART